MTTLTLQHMEKEVDRAQQVTLGIESILRFLHPPYYQPTKRTSGLVMNAIATTKLSSTLFNPSRKSACPGCQGWK
jgi:hypothetical protein